MLFRLPRCLSGWRIHLKCRRHGRHGFDPWVGKSPWRRAWQPTPIYLPGEARGQRSLASYSPYGRKELDMAGATGHAHTCAVCLVYVGRGLLQGIFPTQRSKPRLLCLLLWQEGPLPLAPGKPVCLLVNVKSSS